MNEQDDLASRPPEQESQDSVPSTPPSPGDPTASKLSRKREREVSLEPATPQTATIVCVSILSHLVFHRAQLSGPPSIQPLRSSTDSCPSQDIDIEHPEQKERRTPAKKNRLSAQLDTTREEDEDPALSCSPPHETKIRQISQGVEDLTWQSIRKDNASDKGHDVAAPRAQEQDQGQEVDEKIEAKVAGGEEVAVPLHLLQGENPPVATDGAGDDEHAGQADPAEVPPEAQPSDPEEMTSPTVHPEVSSTSAIPPVPTSQPLSRRGSESDQEKGLKRKLGDRTVSERLVQGETPLTNGTAPTPTTAKRPRDDPDADANPRVTKRPTPPPEEGEAEAQKTEKSPPAPTSVTPKLGGFMAYASSSSPFASVSGPSIFGSKGSSASSSPWASTSTSPNPSPNLITSPFSSTASTSTASPVKSPPRTPAQPQAQKRTGFEAFASATSPFASAAKRPKSPPPPFGALARSRSPSRHTSVRNANPFSTYAAGGAQSFSAHSTPKRGSPALVEGTSTSTDAEGSSKASVGLGILNAGRNENEGADEDEGKENVDGASSFGDRLRSQRDEDESSDEDRQLALTKLEAGKTGEEDEQTVYQVRGKLYALNSQTQWRERGTGNLKLNVRKDDGMGARLIMRKEAVYTLLLNVTLFKGMRCSLAQDPRYLRFSAFEGGSTTHYNLRVPNARIAEELLDEINSHIPSD